jgi:cell division septation protein DedD
MATTQDDSFREIQLSGKQLVFLFMAVTVIGVGIFLMGLLVGRGVLAARGSQVADSAAVALEAEPPPPPAAATPGSSTSPATASEKLSYAERLGSSEPARESLKADASPAPPAAAPTPKAESPAPAASTPPPAPVAAKPSPAAAPPAPAPSPAAKAAEPAGAGFAIQVAALREANEADTIVKRLAGKGYPAYVVAPAKGAPSVYRVRVGKFKERSEADTVAARLQKEEQFKPWIVR